MGKKTQTKAKTAEKTSFLKSVSKSFVYLLIAIIAMLYAPFLDKLSYRSRNFKSQLPAQFDGIYQENELLSKAKKLFTNEIVGPESLAPFEGSLYTGIGDGRILRIRNNNYETVTTIGNGTCSAWEEKRCGRALGNRVTSKGDLYSIDAYHGLVKTSLKAASPKPEIILSSNQVVGDHSSKFLDDLAIDEGAGTSGGNVIYMSDVSRYFDLSQLIALLVDQDDTGRVISYDEVSKQATVLMRNISFPNGVELTDDRSAILVSELTKRQILRHYIKGPKKGTTEVVVDKLPGEPDNIRRSARTEKETYWIALAHPRTSTQFDLLDFAEDKPILRNFVIKTLYSLGNLIKLIGEAIGSDEITMRGWEIKKGILFGLVKLRGMIIEIDLNGNIVSCLHSPDASISLLSEVREVIENGKKVLYLGSVYNNYLGKLVLS